LPDSDARQPLPVVLVNGQTAAGIMAVDIEADSFLSADRFSVRAALSAASAAFWSAVPLLVEIQLAVDGVQASLITGNADRVSIDPIRGEVRASGRDFTSLFVGAQIDESFENQTSSQVVTALAARQGLSAAVTPTQTLVGRYYQNGRTRTAMTQHARATTQWDLICWLAQLENYDVWVSGQTLYFQPAGQNAGGVAISPASCMSLRMDHALDIAAGVTAVVRSWDCVSQTAIVQTASNGGGSPARTVIRPNLSSGEAQSLASRIVSQISSHERVLTIEMPGDVTTAPRMNLALAGSFTDFDGTYGICAVERHLSVGRGFVQTVQARSLPWTAS
jgi:prophage tail gpP-like protein